MILSRDLTDMWLTRISRAYIVLGRFLPDRFLRRVERAVERQELFATMDSHVAAGDDDQLLGENEPGTSSGLHHPHVGQDPDHFHVQQEGMAPPDGRSHLLSSTLSAKDAINAMSERHRPHKVWRRRYAKLIVVGDAGLGKTTLIRTLLSVPGQKLQSHDGNETTIDQFRKNPDALCSYITWQDEEDRVIWKYSVQDTPGYGDRLNIGENIKAMVDFINGRNEAWLSTESSKRRPADLNTVEDPRIDVCLFCLPPHRLRYIDVKYMREIGKVVPVIPVVTKADTMNIREATIYRQEVYSKLQNPRQMGVRGKINLFQFQKETLERAGVDASAAQFKTLPFLVVASNDVNLELSRQGTFWPERQYAWGTCEAFNPDHSDVLQLRLLLLNEGLEEVSSAKLERYEDWRRRRLNTLKFGGNLKIIILAATAVAAFSIGSSIAQGNTVRGLVRSAWKHGWKTALFWRKRRTTPEVAVNTGRRQGRRA